MTMTSPRSRRRALLALALWSGMIGMVAPALAQDPRTSEAQRVAREWLALSDAGDAKATYTAASAKFKSALTLEQWEQALASARAPYGAVKARTLMSAQPALQAPNMPDGVYVMLIYRTNFATRDASETVTMERDGDGVWRLVGYSII
jgi:Protein of unknown function (DUF4019)